MAKFLIATIQVNFGAEHINYKSNIENLKVFSNVLQNLYTIFQVMLLVLWVSWNGIVLIFVWTSR